MVKPENSLKSVKEIDLSQEEPIKVDLKKNPSKVSLESPNESKDKVWDAQQDIETLLKDKKHFESWFSTVKQKMKKRLRALGALNARREIGFSASEVEIAYLILIEELIAEKQWEDSKNIRVDVFCGMPYEYWKSKDHKPELEKPLVNEDGEIITSQQNVVMTFHRQDLYEENYPAFLILPKDYEDTKGDVENMQILKNHLKDFAKVWDYPWFYGLLASMETMTFVKFSKKDNMFYESQTYPIKIKEHYMEDKEADYLKSLYFVIFNSIEAALSEFETRAGVSI